MAEPILDPIRRAAEIVDADNPAPLEHRLKTDIFNSIQRIKPAEVQAVDLQKDVLNGDFFARLPPALQGIAIARTEGALAFYNRVGWHPEFLTAELELCVPDEGLQPLAQRYHAKTLHDLAYVHPKHFEKILGKAGAAALWETLKRFAKDPAAFASNDPE